MAAPKKTPKNAPVSGPPDGDDLPFKSPTKKATPAKKAAPKRTYK